MPFNISNFLANLNKGNLAKSQNFEVMVTRPINGSASASRDLMFRTDSISLPGRDVFTTENMLYGMPSFVGYLSQPSDVSMSIYLSEDMREKIFFEEWIDTIVGTHRTTTGDRMYDVGFYDDYATNAVVLIKQYDSTGNQTHTHTLIEPFPKYVSSNELSWSEDSILKLNVAFAYKRYTSTKITNQ